jgi:hypothetical protein
MCCMGRTYSVKRRTIPNYGRATCLNAHQRCRIEPARVLWREAWHDWKNFSIIFEESVAILWVAEQMFYQSKLV